MGWAVGYVNDRWVGYGVPGICDRPDCGEEIDRGLGAACGGEPYSDDGACDRFFCDSHLYMDNRPGSKARFLCERCIDGEEPFDATPDTPEWVEHLLTDESWQKWRDENPNDVERLRLAPA